MPLVDAEPCPFAFDRAVIGASGAVVFAYFGVINQTALGFGNSSPADDTGRCRRRTR